MKAYQHKTYQWPDDQLAMLQRYEPGPLADGLMRAGPVVALRGIAEVMLNEDWEKLDVMLRNKAFVNYWRMFESDNGVDDRDRGYARQLEEILAKMV